MKDTVYSIRDMEVLSGIKAHTIRIWEKRYNLLEPSRTDTNIRTYSDEELRRILNVSLLVRRGFRISKVASWDEEKIRETIVKMERETPDNEAFLERLTLHMVNFDTDSFNELTEEVIVTYGFEEAFTRVFFPFFQRIGTYWQVGSVFPAQEHYVSNLFRQKLIAGIDRLGHGTKDQPGILFYLHENEMHELSLLYYAYLARSIGYRIYYLGQNVPLEDLKKIAHLAEIKFVFTVFINALAADDLNNYLQELKNAIPGKKYFITGRQLSINQPVLPRNFKIIENYRDFRKYLA